MIKISWDSISAPLIETWTDPTKMQFELTVPERNNACKIHLLKYGTKINILNKTMYRVNNIGFLLSGIIDNDRVTFLLQYEEHSHTGEDLFICGRVKHRPFATR